MSNITEHILAFFGLILILALLYQLSSFVYFYFIQGPAIQRYRHGKESWAMVTGASAGIGFGLSQEITKYGFNVILIGHKRDELEQAVSQIQNTSPGAKTKVVVLDATKAMYKDIKAALESYNISALDVTVLINNVGGLGDIFTDRFKPFHTYTSLELDSVMAINNRFMVYLTRLMIPVLSCSGKPSVIINIGSLAESGVVYQVLYSGCKGFIHSFSKALDWELKTEGYNIDVVDVVPGEVQTSGLAIAESWRRPNAALFARHVLKRIGPGRGRWVIPYPAHRILLCVLMLIPESVQRKALVENMVKMRDEVEGKKGL